MTNVVTIQYTGHNNEDGRSVRGWNLEELKKETAEVRDLLMHITEGIPTEDLADLFTTILFVNAGDDGLTGGELMALIDRMRHITDKTLGMWGLEKRDKGVCR